jgi:hypothetical protein
MRVLHAATLVAAAAILTGPLASAQSLGEAAARERAKKKGKTEPVKVFTDDDLRSAGGIANVPAAVDAPASADGQAKAEGEKAGQAKKQKEKTPDELQAEQQAAWRKKVDHIQSEVNRIRGMVTAMQRDLNDTSGGVYTPRRASLQTGLDEAQKNLAAAEQMLADLQEEGRRNGYR